MMLRLNLKPNYGDAHVGMAFADLQLHRAKPAIHEADLAAGIMKDSAAIHLARAEGYRQQMLFRDAEREYRAALQLAPNDPRVYLALAEALYGLARERGVGMALPTPAPVPLTFAEGGKLG